VGENYALRMIVMTPVLKKDKVKIYHFTISAVFRRMYRRIDSCLGRL